MKRNMDADEILAGLEKAGYYADRRIAFAVAAADSGIPILVTGDSGSGKTSLAYAVSRMLDLPLIRVQFYEGLTDDRILYDFD